MCYTTTDSISLSPALAMSKKIHRTQNTLSLLNFKVHKQGRIAFSQIAIASGVLATSQLQILGPLPQKEYSIARHEIEACMDHFSLGMEPLSFLK